MAHITTELAALDRERLSFDSLRFLIDEINDVEGLKPVPTALNLRNFNRAIDAAFDRDMLLEELETNAALELVPVRADDPDPDPSEEASEEPGEDSQAEDDDGSEDDE